MLYSHSTKFKRSEIDADSDAGELKSPEHLQKGIPCLLLYPASGICGEGRAILVPEGVGRERQSQAIAPDLQTLWKRQLTVVPGTPWDLPQRTINGMLGLGKSDVFETRA